VKSLFYFFIDVIDTNLFRRQILGSCLFMKKSDGEEAGDDNDFLVCSKAPVNYLIIK